MDNRQPDSNPDSRRRRLDDLFGDEPFLSPTMKARRLHEKLHTPEIVSIEEITVEGLHRAPQSTALVRPDSYPETVPDVPEDGSPRLQLLCFGEELQQQASGQQAGITLADAASILRGGVIPNSQVEFVEPLKQFREQVLMQWIKGAPARDTDQNRRTKILGQLK